MVVVALVVVLFTVWKFVVEAVMALKSVAKKLVVVAEVPVALTKVKFCKVVEARWRDCPVVVAPPKMVKPLPVVPPPIVLEALAIKLAKFVVPVKVGEALKTLTPVPVLSVRAEARLAEEGAPRKVAMPVAKPETSAEIETELQVGTPSALKPLTNWLVQACAA